MSARHFVHCRHQIGSCLPLENKGRRSRSHDLFNGNRLIMNAQNDDLNSGCRLLSSLATLSSWRPATTMARSGWSLLAASNKEFLSATHNDSIKHSFQQSPDTLKHVLMAVGQHHAVLSHSGYSISLLMVIFRFF